MTSEFGIISIVSTRDPDGEPACGITWGALQWYASVDDVRETAMDIMTVAAYADMMMDLVKHGLDPQMVATVMSSVLSASVGPKRVFGTRNTVTMLPMGASKQKVAVVGFKRGKMEEAVSTADARKMAGHWLEIAEATESDQLVAEALRATGIAGEEDQERLFGYLRSLRSRTS